MPPAAQSPTLPEERPDHQPSGNEQPGEERESRSADPDSAGMSKTTPAEPDYRVAEGRVTVTAAEERPAADAYESFDHSGGRVVILVAFPIITLLPLMLMQ